ncbi:MAG: radical SAM family heme chaperone HemW [Chitinophagaceae bacterium]|nr:radical SAM family heme chaperone HemW [Chitinophagaceae bacterium]
MAGIYIHIPFCKKACHYCDFHFSTSLTYKNELIQQLLMEIELRKEYLKGDVVDTIYFGGGTPSLLSKGELIAILDKIHNTFRVHDTIECTLEANPDDLSSDTLIALNDAGINRLSIGIQSFFDEDLQYMNRSHDAAQAARCIDAARDAGIENVSIDLIFGYPLLSDDKWKQNIDTALTYEVPHLSCYAMTVEPKTALASFIKSKKTLPINHEQSASQFEYLMKALQAKGYEHYEISNYALSGKRAVHNSNYWKGIPYLGIGPSAHSFDGVSRQWNVANNMTYIKSLGEGIVPFEQEVLTETQQLNERIMTSLRTMEGFDMAYHKNKCSMEDAFAFDKTVQHFIQEGLLVVENDVIKLTQQGKLFADYVAGELFV